MELGYSSQIYLDYNATTPCKESVVKEINISGMLLVVIIPLAGLQKMH